jgi:hypothetical protein
VRSVVRGSPSNYLPPFVIPSFNRLLSVYHVEGHLSVPPSGPMMNIIGPLPTQLTTTFVTDRNRLSRSCKLRAIKISIDPYVSEVIEMFAPYSREF